MYGSHVLGHFKAGRPRNLAQHLSLARVCVPASLPDAQVLMSQIQKHTHTHTNQQRQHARTWLEIGNLSAPTTISTQTRHCTPTRMRMTGGGAAHATLPLMPPGCAANKPARGQRRRMGMLGGGAWWPAPCACPTRAACPLTLSSGHCMRNHQGARKVRTGAGRWRMLG